MKLSHYVKSYPYEEKAGYRLLYSTKQYATLLVPEEVLEAIEGDDLTDGETELLLTHGIITEDRKKEKREVAGRLDAFNKENPELDITVILNLDCNFDCIYCYEGDMKGRHYLAEETADHLVAFIKEKFAPGKTSLHINFHGGEPLLSWKMIAQISRELAPFAEERGAIYTFTLVTNGSLFTRKVAEALAPLGLARVKITLDGPAATHDRSRPFKNGKGSFDAIVRNIKETNDLARIGLGGNFDEHTWRSFPKLLDDLLAEGLTPDEIATVKFDPVIKPADGIELASGYTGGCDSQNTPWVREAFDTLREEILRRGFETPKPGPLRCLVETSDAYVVNYDGTLYKCPAFVGNGALAVGSLTDGVDETAPDYELALYKNAECLDCEYLPLCFGGCRQMTFLREKNMHSVDCLRKYLDATLETIVKQDTRHGR